MNKLIFLALSGFMISASCFAADVNAGNDDVATKNSKVKYKSVKEVDFDSLLIQGQMRRPELSIVTGDADDGTQGLLKLRKDFFDRAAVDFGEDVQ